jgi:Secretion system C-terminal sorting domain
MKNSITYITLLLALNLSYGQTTLAAGDIAITGFNSVLPDGFSFVLLTDIENGTEIKFTDQGWISTGGFREIDEGEITWTATSNLSCGTEVIVTYVSNGTIYSASTGTAIETGLGFRLNLGNDQLLAYQGNRTSPTFIYAINFDNAGWSDAVDGDTSALPSGLINSKNAIDLGETYNGKYNCTVTTEQSLILAAVSTTGNWNLSNTLLTLGDCGGFSCATICSGTTVTWEVGGWKDGINPDITTPVTINSPYSTTTNGSFSACNLMVSAAFTLTINDGDYVEVENNIIANGNITVRPQGVVMQNDNFGEVTGTGNITVVKKTAPANVWYEYTYWSSPVVDEIINGGLFEAETNRRFWFNAQNFLDKTKETSNNNAADEGQDDIDDNGDDWQLANGTDIMIPGVGYASTHSESNFILPPGPNPPPPQFDYTFNGFFNNGVITVPLYRNDEELEDNNWNLIGNPYPSAIDATKFLDTNTSIDTIATQSPTITGAIFLWSQNTAPSGNANGNENENFAGSDYAVINGTGNVAGGDGLTPNNYIPSGQSFFVSMSDDAPSSVFSVGDPVIPGDIVTTNIIFNNSMRVTGSNDQFFRVTGSKTKESTNKIWFNLTSDNGVFNQILIGYVKGATNGFDGDYFDAPRNLSIDNASVLYSTIEGNNKKFSIQGRAKNSLTVNEIISIGFKTTIDVPTIYTLSIGQLQGEFLNENHIYLKDNSLNILHNLKESDYNFTSTVGEFNNRFEIVFNENALSLYGQAITNNNLSIIELQNGNIQFKLSRNIAMKSIQIIDLQGRVLYNLKAESNSKTYNLSNLSKAPYLAKVTLSNGTTITKKAIKRN